ncbi:hypothetical protein [Hymenobacter metallilatus]|uniref:Uncharacterized protein n=1 Tax=Hymenobacter metallilatus TaxID=2493666 RepID=A0A428JRR1_9BACT|nr:hypothetical protein [Hymenobacter metallilatus]RSK36217.1 hypothetical protein EI290_04855 [Hymenobacter metallilatus]
MRTLLMLLLLTPAAPLLAQTAPAKPAWTDHRRVLPDKLRQVPVGLTLWHTPNPNYPEPNPAQPGAYLWKHSTLLRSEVGELTVVECGSFIWYDETGWKQNLTQTPAEFAELFQCPGGRLLTGRTYTFAKNYRYADNARQLYGGDALWYILARDAAGKLYKGMGLLETEATVR